MFHLDNGSGIDVMPPQKQTISRQQKWFTEGDTQTPPSYPGADWFNIVQAELLNVLKDGGITPSKSELSQLSAAIRSIINKNQIKISDASLTSKGVVQLNSATDSTIENQAATPKSVKIVSDKVKAISERFEFDDFESRVRSPDHRFHLSVKNDGTVSMYSHLKNDFSWHINHDGYINGYVAADKIYGLDEFVRNRVLPVGIPQPWPSDHLPAGWLECNGSPFNVNQFPKLAAVYPWGTLPDLRGLFIRGKDNGRGLDPNRAILSYQDDAIRNIWGEISPISESFAANPTSIGAFRAFEKQSNNTPAYIDASSAGGVTFDASRVVPVSHDNHPRNLAFIYIVKAE